MHIRKSRHQDAVERIADWIVAGRFNGARALPTESEVGAELGVSRTVVREAMRTLTAKGLVDVRPRHGTTVRPQDDWQLFDPQVIEWRMKAGVPRKLANDLIEFRLAIEPFAARLAAARRDFPQASLVEAFERMTAATEGEGDYHAADLAFHQTILTGTRNEFIRHLAPIMSSTLKLSFKLSVLSMETARASLPMHRAVADAIAAHDTEAAGRALAVLIESARDDMLVALDRVEANEGD